MIAHALGLVAKRLHKIPEAEQLLQAAYDGYLLVHKSAPNHLNIAETAFVLAIINVQYGYRFKALTYFQTAHDIFDTILGPGHRLTCHAADCELFCIESQLKQTLDPRRLSTQEGRFYSQRLWKNESRCFNCKQLFGLPFLTSTGKRHHCRVCAESVCNSCSSFQCVVYEFDKNKPSRICRQCFDEGF